MIPEEHRAFVEDHNLAIVGFARRSGAPSLSPVHYYIDGEEIVFSTTKARGKGKAVARTGELSLCILDMRPPFAYVTVSGEARVDESSAVEAMVRAAEIATGQKLADAVRPTFEQRARSEGRVAVRVKPTRFFAVTPMA